MHNEVTSEKAYFFFNLIVAKSILFLPITATLATDASYKLAFTCIRFFSPSLVAVSLNN
jgi:hypothetical protein